MPALEWARAKANYGVGTISSALRRIAALSLTTSKLAKKMLFLNECTGSLHRLAERRVDQMPRRLKHVNDQGTEGQSAHWW